MTLDGVGVSWSWCLGRFAHSSDLLYTGSDTLIQFFPPQLKHSGYYYCYGDDYDGRSFISVAKLKHMVILNFYQFFYHDTYNVSIDEDTNFK